MSVSTSILDYLAQGLHADRPVSPNVPSGGTAIYCETDTGNTFAWVAGSWVQINGGGGGGGSAWSPFIPNGWTFTAPSAGDFTLNKSTGSTAAVADLGNSKGIVLSNSANGLSAINAAAVEAVLSQSAFTVTALLFAAGSLDNNWACGICIEDNAGLYQQFGWRNATNGLGVLNVFNYSSIDSVASSTNQFGDFNPNGPMWVRVQLTGGNFIFSYSFDGENFEQVLSASKTAFLGSTLSNVGIMLANAASASGKKFFLDCFNWSNTTP